VLFPFGTFFLFKILIFFENQEHNRNLETRYNLELECIAAQPSILNLHVDDRITKKAELGLIYFAKYFRFFEPFTFLKFPRLAALRRKSKYSKYIEITLKRPCRSSYRLLVDFPSLLLNLML